MWANLLLILFVVIGLILVWRLLKFIFKWALIASVILLAVYFLSTMNPTFDSYLKDSNEIIVNEIDVYAPGYLFVKSSFMVGDDFKIDLARENGDIVFSKNASVNFGRVNKAYDLSEGEFIPGVYILKVYSDDYLYERKFLAYD